MQTKTIRQWLNDLPEPYRTQAFENATLSDDGLDMAPHENTLYCALSCSFTFINSPQGHKYWQDVKDGIFHIPTNEDVRMKTIRFEKGTIHWPHHLPDVEGIEVFFDQTDNDWPRVKVIKSFTVQINIIEDEKQEQHYDKDGNIIMGHFEYDVVKQTEKYIPYEESRIICAHPEWGTDGGGDYCKKCGYRL